MHPRAPHWVAIAAVAGALLAWWLWPQGADAPTSETPVSTDAQGRVRLTRQQERNLGIRTERSRAATDVPVTGLPAEAMSPLATTTQVTVPFAGVVTRVLVDEGEQVRRGQPLLRVQSRDFIALQGELARVRAESGAAKEQARRDALLAKEGIIPAARRIESEARSAAASASVTEASAMLSQLRRPAEGMPGEYDILAPQAGRILRRGVRPGQAMEAMAPAFVMAGSTELDIVFTSPIGLHWHASLTPPARRGSSSWARSTAVGTPTSPASTRTRHRPQAPSPRQAVRTRKSVGSRIARSESPAAGS